MKKNITHLTKGGTDLIKNSSLMARIDDDALNEKKTHEVGGAAYESQYIDNMTVTHLMSLQKTDKKQSSVDDDDAKFPVFWVVTILGIALLIALYIVYKL